MGEATLHFDLVADFAQPFPATVMIELLGVRPEGHGIIRASTEAWAEFLAIVKPVPGRLEHLAAAHRLENRFGAFLGVDGDFLGQTRRFVCVRLHLIDGHVHLVHRRRRLFSGQRQTIDVLGNLANRLRHFFDRRHGDDVLKNAAAAAKANAYAKGKKGGGEEIRA